MNTILKNGTVITLNNRNEILSCADILIKDECIAAVGKDIKADPDTKIIDCTDCIIMPGLVNAHTHVPMILLRSLADDCSLSSWLNDYIWPAEQKITREDVYWGTLLSIAEMLSYGITSFSDMYHFATSVAKATSETGIKARFANGITCKEGNYIPSMHPATKESIDLIEKWHGFNNGTILCDTTIQSEFQTNPDVWRFIAKLAKEYNVGIHMHLSETEAEQSACIQKYGKTPVELFDESGVFENRVVAAHCNFLSQSDINIVSNSNFTCVHDPCSNLKMCSGFINLKPFVEKKINIALGTDGVCSSNSNDLFETMKITSLIQKMITKDPEFLTSEQLLRIATQGGLKAQGRENESGVIEKGRDADLIVINKSEGMFPEFNPEANLIYSCNGSHVSKTIVRGKILYDNGMFSTIDIKEVKKNIRRITEKF